MTVDSFINALNAIKEKVGGDAEVPVVTLEGENDYIVADYPVVGDFEDQDGNKYKCALVGSMGGEEFTSVDTPHYEWKPQNYAINY